MPTEISGSTGVNKIQDGTIVNADINSSAAIAGSKISGSFGKVLQVINVEHGSESSSTSTSWADNGLSATITPSSSSSKVLALVQVGGVAKQAGNGVKLRFLRGSTVLNTLTEKAGFTFSSEYNYIGTVSFSWLDSPSTTSATTYKMQFRTNSSGAAALTEVDNDTSTITLLEIAG